MKELAIVVPTFNERQNIRPLLQSLADALVNVSYEVVFVDDDSPDGTAEFVRQIAQEDDRVRILHRVNRRGLASACLEGMLATATPYVCVMDADLQHDEQIIPEMLNRIKQDNTDIVIGSRNVPGGSMGNFARERVALSMLGRWVAARVCHSEVQDPMSGFFLLRRQFLNEAVYHVSAIGFKILLDLLASVRRPVRIAEVPYTFRSRHAGESKLDLMVGLEYLQLIIDKLFGSYIPSSFLIFSLVGTFGVLCYAAVLWFMLSALHFGFGKSQAVAATAAMTVNFLLNNVITYRDRRLRGWAVIRGLVLFYAACSVGLLVNVQVAEAVHRTISSPLIAGLVGLAVGSVWNYGVTRVFTWRAFQHVRRR